jgi:hypothetical protein
MMEIIKCCVCTIEFAVNEDFFQMRKRDGEGFFCPVGHKQHFSENEIDRLKQENRYLRDRKEELELHSQMMKHVANGYKGQLAKVKKQLAAQGEVEVSS